MTTVLMPKATAVWLVDNTSLTFEQIAEFCGLHVLEVKGIADGDVAQGIRGEDPISAGQLSRDEIEKAEQNADYRMKVHVGRHSRLQKTERRGARYTPISRRQDRPDAIDWMVRNHPEVSDAQIAKLLGTTKTTIEAVRSGSHWNSQNIKPTDPVALGLCTQIELDAIVRKAMSKKEKMIEEAKAKVEEGPSMKPNSGAKIGAGVIMADDDAFVDEADLDAPPADVMDEASYDEYDNIDPESIFSKSTSNTEDETTDESETKDAH